AEPAGIHGGFSGGNDVGGRVGRKIIMNSKTGVVMVGKGRKAASCD
nr:hypothetical protein [Pseudomonadota bacterium]